MEPYLVVIMCLYVPQPYSGKACIQLLYIVARAQGNRIVWMQVIKALKRNFTRKTHGKHGI